MICTVVIWLKLSLSLVILAALLLSSSTNVQVQVQSLFTKCALIEHIPEASPKDHYQLLTHSLKVPVATLI